MYGIRKGKRVEIRVVSVPTGGWVGELRSRNGLVVVWQTQPCKTPEIARALAEGELDFGAQITHSSRSRIPAR